MSPDPVATLEALKVFLKGSKAGRILPWAAGIAAVGVSAALILRFFRDPAIAVFSIIIMFALMVVGVIFLILATKGGAALRILAIIFAYGCVILFFGSAILLVTSFFFAWPRVLASEVTSDSVGPDRSEFGHDGSFVPTDGAKNFQSVPSSIRSVKDPTVRFVLVPKSESTFGTNDPSANGDERPAIQATIPSYYISVYEITNAQFQKFISECSHVPVPKGTEPWAVPYSWDPVSRTPKPGRKELPVTLVTWEQATEYCKWIGARLPNEFEWEKAARGESSSKYPWGDNWDPALCNNVERLGAPQFDSDKERDTWIHTEFVKLDPVLRNNNTLQAVGSHSRDCSRYGVFDLGGNAAEWCSDWYDPERYKRWMDQPSGPMPPPVDGDAVKSRLPPGSDAGLTKIVKGGSWMTSAFGCRITHRKYEVPKDADGPLGFRPVLPVSWYLKQGPSPKDSDR